MRRREFLAGCGLTVAGGLAPKALPRGAALPFNSLAETPTQSGQASAIFPPPREVAPSGQSFFLDSDCVILVPEAASPQDISLARFFRDELSDWYGVTLAIDGAAHRDPAKRSIILGSVTNSLVSECCRQSKLATGTKDPGPEGYRLDVNAQRILVAGSDDRGAFYGVQSLRQLTAEADGRLAVAGLSVRDWPDKPFRGMKLYIPGRDHIPFFKRLVRNCLALHKYNTLVLEMNASMRLDSHPELNSAWREFARDTDYSRLNYPPGALHHREQNSSHQDTGDGDFLEKEEVADLARFVREHHIELIPELPSLTHSFYLLSAHRELSAVPGEKWPDTYCPSNPDTYKLLFEVYDEYIDVLKPNMIHIGHDELFAPVNAGSTCVQKDIREAYGEDVKRIHSYLADKGVKTAMWGDMLLEGVRGKEFREEKAPDGWRYHASGGLTQEQVRRLIPKDILIFNWFWNPESRLWDQTQAEGFESLLDNLGFHQIYGNFNPTIVNYGAREKRTTILGGAPSAWAATTEFNFGKTVLWDILGVSSILWSGEVIRGRPLSEVIQSRMQQLRYGLRGRRPPSQTEPSAVPVPLSTYFNMRAAENEMDVNLSGVANKIAFLGKVPFDLSTLNGKAAVIVQTAGRGYSNLPREVNGIGVAQDATSLLFLHACAKAASNREVYYLLWDKEDSADLLGWYEVVYEDGFTTTIPIRYGVDIAEWNWRSRELDRDYCYGADAVALGGSGPSAITFFALEWENPRLGKVIAEIRLKGTHGFRGADTDFSNNWGPEIPTNAIMLKAISVVKKRGAPEIERNK